VKRTTILLCASLCVLAGCAGSDSQLRSKPHPERAAEINLELGVDYLRKGNLEQAKEKIERSLDQDGRSARAHSVAGMLYARLGDEKKAESHFDRAISLDSDNPEIRNNYAVYLCQGGAYSRGERQALAAAENALYKTPEAALLNAGNCARSAGDLKRAEEHYRRALQLRPRFAEALYLMAEMQFQQTQYISARAFLQRFMEVGRTSPATLWLGHRIERSLGNRAEAQHYARRLKTEYPNAAQTKELLESERNAG
jgi:type IV pilus assembly protein PilF